MFVTDDDAREEYAHETSDRSFTVCGPALLNQPPWGVRASRPTPSPAYRLLDSVGVDGQMPSIKRT